MHDPTQIRVGLAWTFGADGDAARASVLLDVLGGVAQTGSLAEAARSLGMSYRHAWGLVKGWEARLGSSVVAGARGRGATLTPLGVALVEVDARAQRRMAAQLATAQEEMAAALHAHGGPRSESRVRVHASHDPLLARLPELLGQGGPAVEMHFLGSAESLRSLAEGRCEVAGFHLPGGALGRGLWNAYARYLDPRRHGLVRVFRRTQGLIVEHGNPLRIAGVEDLARPGVRFVNRQSGSGTRLLLDAMLAARRMAPAGIAGYAIEEHTHAAVAAMVASGHADAGLGVSAAAAEFRLDFVPLVEEHYLFAAAIDWLDGAAGAGLLASVREGGFAQAVREAPGYRAAGSGTRTSVSAFAATLRAR